jgi:hypothetical protein
MDDYHSTIDPAFPTQSVGTASKTAEDATLYVWSGQDIVHEKLVASSFCCVTEPAKKSMMIKAFSSVTDSNPGTYTLN